jgi:hypothetical protein
MTADREHPTSRPQGRPASYPTRDGPSALQALGSHRPELERPPWRAAPEAKSLAGQSATGSPTNRAEAGLAITSDDNEIFWPDHGEAPMTPPLHATTLVRAEHVRSFHLHPARSGGWEATEHEDQRVVRQERYTDWHRVEQVLSRFARDIAGLREQGWREA